MDSVKNPFILKNEIVNVNHLNFREILQIQIKFIVVGFTY